MRAVLTALHVYPVKSCRGLSPAAWTLEAEGFAHDRRWLVVSAEGRFLTQREAPALARVAAGIEDGTLTLALPDGTRLRPAPASDAAPREVVVWGDRCAARDCGDEVAERLGALLGRAVRLVEHDPGIARTKQSPRLPGPIPVRFPDSHPLLLVSEESLANLNARLPAALPMDRFRPNLVVRGLGVHGEDRVAELRVGGVRLRPVKACTRCVVTTTDQDTGARDGEEPLRTLKTYRWDEELRGVTFGQNVAVAAGVGATLRIGDEFEVEWRRAPPA